MVETSYLILSVFFFVLIAVVGTTVICVSEDPSGNKVSTIIVILGINFGIFISGYRFALNDGMSPEKVNASLQVVAEKVKYCKDNNYTLEEMSTYVESMDLYTDDPYIMKVVVDEYSLEESSKYISIGVITPDGLKFIAESKSEVGGNVE